MTNRKPNLGNLELKLKAMDDAVLVEPVLLESIATGKIAMPFLHPRLLRLYFERKGIPLLYEQLCIIEMAAIIRNARLIRKINPILASKNLLLLPITEEMVSLEQRKEMLEFRARQIQVDLSLYFDESSDQDDLEQCTSPFCLNQLVEPGKAADSIRIIIDKNSIPWVVLIKRKYGPGRGQYAYAGGFVDDNETFAAAADREAEEETGMELECANSEETFEIETEEIPPAHYLGWDPRARFPYGIVIGAKVTVYKFKQIATSVFNFI